jgi:hypothetical protein
MQELAISYVAFDLNPVRVAEASRRGLPVFYGDGAQPSVLHAAGERERERPKKIEYLYACTCVLVCERERGTEGGVEKERRRQREGEREGGSV